MVPRLTLPLRAALLLAVPFAILGAVALTVRAEGEPPSSSPRTTILTNTFTYQGRVAQDGIPLTGSCDFEFRLFNASGEGTQIGSTLTRLAVPVNGGLFTTQLDFGPGAFDGQDRYLETALRCPAGAGAYTTLSGRQALTPSPYAMFATGSAGGGAGGWSLNGNAGTSSSNFLGTTDGMPFEIRAGNERVLRFQPVGSSPSLVGGHFSNEVASSVFGGTIGGGGASQDPNLVLDDYGTIGGGLHNTAGSNDSNPGSATGSTIGGGGYNTASGPYSTISGGSTNTATSLRATVGGGYLNNATDVNATVAGGSENLGSGAGSAIAGGFQNQATNANSAVGGGWLNKATGLTAVVGGGYSNTASSNDSTISGGTSNIASGSRSAVGGGNSNQATHEGTTVGGGYFNKAEVYFATVAGGYENTASGEFTAVGGGRSNVVSGDYATVPGGSSNTASGFQSFAAGGNATADDIGAFVWGDNAGVEINSPGDNTFSVRASGGIWLGTTSTPSIGAGNFLNTSTGARLTTGGTWTNSSDVNLKTNFHAVDTRSVLETLLAMPVTTWNYRAESSDVRRMGPTVQDFYAAFGLGDSDKSISTIDGQGVAFAAIQGLYQVMQDENANIRTENADLRAENATLESRIERLESAAGFTPPQDARTPLPTWLLIALALGSGASGALLIRKRQ